MIIDVIKVILPATTAFFVGIVITPFISHVLYAKKLWKKQARRVSFDGSATPIFNALHRDREVGTPKLGGAVIWLSALITILAFWLLGNISDTELTGKLDFLSRDQTWLPLFTLMVGAIVGATDDFLAVRGGGGYIAGGMSLKKRLAIVGLIGLAAALWFYYKLEVSAIGIPFLGETELGLWFIPFFVLVVMATYSGGIIDGIDGLAGGIFATIFGAYGTIAFYQDQINLAAFSAVVAGSILAFLWFNISPARFYMSETGTMALTLSLATIAFMSDTLGGGHGVIVLPIIAFPLVITAASAIIQIVSKRWFGRKVFLVAPLHHHFEALGWPPYKVTMRYWVIGVIFALLGTVVGLIG